MNNTILITGGSRGIGAATALMAAERGYDIVVNYVTDKDAAQKVVDTIKAKGRKAIAIQADVSSEEQVIRMFEETDKKLGGLTALVNNAGVLSKQMRVDEMDAARLKRIFDINILGSFLCAREAVKRMSTKNGGAGGCIVNVSSNAARTGSPGEYVDYAASKGAIDSMTLGLSKEVAEEGIRVNCVRPGFIYTDIHSSGGEPGRVDRIKATVPMKRGGRPEEVATAILWLVSGESSFCTGTFIDVTGGK
jgi:NAD(P)-dependent dehydrogenase (short-subunit alcohol dehydrogenase family)